MLRPPDLAQVLRVLLALPFGCAAWFLSYVYARDESQIVWECDVSACGTDDWRAMALIGGIAAAVASGVLAFVLTQHATVGLAMALVASALAAGWNASVLDHGVDRGDVDAWIIAATAIAVIGAVAALLGALHTAKRTALVPRLFLGHVAVPARAYPAPAGSDARTSMLAFVDHNGRRRDVAVELPPEHRNRPLLAVYDKRTPSAAERPRVAVPRLMATESARTASLAKLRSAMRIETDRRASTASPRQGRDGTVVGELERLAALHSDGSLTDEEFAAAKHRLLGL